MKKDLRSIMKNSGDSPMPEPNRENIDSINRLVGQYSSMSTDELFNEINKGRASGRISDADIDNLHHLIGPMLPPEQQRRLSEIIQKLGKSGN